GAAARFAGANRQRDRETKENSVHVRMAPTIDWKEPHAPALHWLYITLWLPNEPLASQGRALGDHRIGLHSPQNGRMLTLTAERSTTMGLGGWIFLGVIVALVLWAISAYNRMVGARNQ